MVFLDRILKTSDFSDLFIDEFSVVLSFMR